MKTIWNQIRKPGKFARLIRQAAEKELHWQSLYNCGIGYIIRLNGDDMSDGMEEVPEGTVLTNKTGSVSVRISKPRKIFASKYLGADYGLNKRDPFSNSVRSLWCVSPNHPSLIRLMEEFGLDMSHVRAIEMTNDHAILKRLALRDIFPPAKLYKDAKFHRTYLLEIAALLEEGKKMKVTRIAAQPAALHYNIV